MIFTKVAEVRDGGVRETLHWDGRDGFMLEASFAAMGQRTEVEKTTEEAQRCLEEWGLMNLRDDDFEVLHADERQLDKIMEGLEWHPLSTTR